MEIATLYHLRDLYDRLEDRQADLDAIYRLHAVRTDGIRSGNTGSETDQGLQKTITADRIQDEITAIVGEIAELEAELITIQDCRIMNEIIERFILRTKGKHPSQRLIDYLNNHDKAVN